jgi:hypothetical protein
MVSLTVTCDAVDREIRNGRSCAVIRAYRSDRAPAQSKGDVAAALRRVKAGSRSKPRAYPRTPLRIRIEGERIDLTAEEVEIYELSVGITCFNLCVCTEQPDDLEWLIGKELELEEPSVPSRLSG